MPKKVAHEIIALQQRFFWGGNEGGRDMPLEKWEVIQLRKKLGGLGVGDIVMKNIALMFK